MNTKMKVLSLALVGLCGFAGSAMAACPAGPTTADGGAWTAKSVSAGSHLTIGTPGLDGTECRLNSDIAGSLTGTAVVSYTHAASEPSYRFQFLVDPSALSGSSLTENVTVFRANATNTANGSGNALQVYLIGASGGARRLRFIVACNNSATNYRCAAPITFDLPAGAARVEGKLTFGAGAAGQLDAWVNAPAGTTEPPTTSVTIANLDNTAWGGASQAILGLVSPNTPFKNSHAGQVVAFDRFDSRRQTYIGS
jgi:hypothetical protein